MNLLVRAERLQDAKQSFEKIGLHCPTEIVQAVLKDAAATVQTRRDAVATKDSRDSERDRQLLLGNFPAIPTADVDHIMLHGFEKGSGRVGRTNKLDEDSKFELAVKAHIRHKFTDYDEYWKQMKAGTHAILTKTQARARVASQVQSIAASWSVNRGDKDAVMSASVRRSTRWAKKTVDPLRTTRETERQKRKDGNSNKIRKTRTSCKAKKYNEEALEVILGDLSLDGVAWVKAPKKVKILKRESKDSAAVEKSLSRRIDKLMGRAKRAADLRIKLGHGEYPDVSEMTRLHVIEQLKCRANGIDDPSPIIPSDNLITNYFCNEHGNPTTDPLHDSNSVHTPGKTEAAMSKTGKNQRKSKQVLKDLENLKMNPYVKLSDKRLVKAFNFGASFSDGSNSISGIAKARFQDAVKRREEVAADGAQRKARENNAVASAGTTTLAPVTPMNVSERHGALEIDLDTEEDDEMSNAREM